MGGVGDPARGRGGLAGGGEAPACRVVAARIARQKEIDASIAAKAESEYLYDRPYSDNSRTRVAGPFTVESLSPHRIVPGDADDSLVHELAEPGGGWQDFGQMVLEKT